MKKYAMKMDRMSMNDDMKAGDVSKKPLKKQGKIIRRSCWANTNIYLESEMKTSVKAILN
jgi:hypothetical protein